MLIASSAFSAVGMFLLTRADSGSTATVAAVIFAVGVCFFWPTMLGVASERFPRSGALGMSIMGGIGTISTAIWLPIVGHYYDTGIANALPPGKTEAVLKAAAAGSEDAKTWAATQAAGGRAGLGILVYLPIILLAVFVALFLYDKSRGGYKKEVLVQQQAEAEAEPMVTPL